MTGQPALEEAPSEFRDDTLYQSNLLVKRHQDIFALDWHNFAENYARGYTAIYLLIKPAIPDGDEHAFPFLIIKDKITIGGGNAQLFEIGANSWGSSNADRMGLPGDDLDQFFPMLVRISDLVNGPESIIPSGVWSLGFNDRPLLGSEFLFYSLLDPPVWEWIRLPVAHSAEGEPYTRHTPAILSDKRDDHFIKRRAEVSYSLHDLKGEISGKVFIEVCDYVKKVRMAFEAERMGLGLNVPVDARFKVSKLMFSSFDLFL